MTASSKTPSASGISRLLAAAGFERSTSIGNGVMSAGFEVTIAPDAGTVWVGRNTRLMQPPKQAADRRRRELAAYAAVIASAGYATEVGEYRLIVTAKAED